jgi:hypothetical protein
VPDRDEPDYKGPYDADKYGEDVFGHPVNAFGRCEGLNAQPPTCPPAEEV